MLRHVFSTHSHKGTLSAWEPANKRMTTSYEICHREPTEPAGEGEEIVVLLQDSGTIASATNFGGFVFNCPLAQELLDL